MDEILVLNKGRLESRGQAMELNGKDRFSYFINEASLTHEEETNKQKERLEKRGRKDLKEKEIITKEDQAEGRVQLSSLLKYLAGAHPLVLIIGVILNLLPLVVQTYLRLYLVHWIELPSY